MLEHSFYFPDDPGFSKMDIVKKIINLYEKNPGIISNRLLDLLSRNETMLRGLLNANHEMKITSITRDGKVNIFTDRKTNGSSVHVILSLSTMNDEKLRRISEDIQGEEII